ncbi:MAG: hypothetical protein AVDCRST_MAG66-2914 [uncultured Pseudonocardia sp.]|uniref:Uncharacterized protein n=1 Tax=uncultured Pseudonocardia sp. TaxID=211455 RepID=A0A6J4Q170_9PSEU|nr:MAG: hypothetical protein AVDCRST_MAG66-2914 [uncultured Pseudonocardia sp.]
MVRTQPIHSIMDVGGPRLIPPRMVTRRLPGQRRAHASGYHRRVVEVARAPPPTADRGSPRCLPPSFRWSPDG